jgi:hypothetical protein
VDDAVYDLYLSKDTNTRGNFQWFLFAIDGVQAGVEVRESTCRLPFSQCQFIPQHQLGFASASDQPLTPYTIALSPPLSRRRHRVALVHYTNQEHAKAGQPVRTLSIDTRTASL